LLEISVGLKKQMVIPVVLTVQNQYSNKMEDYMVLNVVNFVVLMHFNLYQMKNVGLNNMVMIVVYYHIHQLHMLMKPENMVLKSNGVVLLEGKM